MLLKGKAHLSRQHRPAPPQPRYLPALSHRLHPLLYVLHCEICYFLFDLEFFQPGWWLSQWLLSRVHLEEDTF